MDNPLNITDAPEYMWTRAEALTLLATLESHMARCKSKTHVALGGSVLYRGHSDKDLDVILYPHTAEEWDTFTVKKMLMAYFDVNLNDCKGISQMRDAKEVAWLTTKAGKRIDFFFLK